MLLGVCCQSAERIESTPTRGHHELHNGITRFPTLGCPRRFVRRQSRLIAVGRLSYNALHLGVAVLVVRELNWTPSNVAHIAKRGIQPRDVEDVCQAAHIVRQGYDQRIMIIGPNRRYRMIAVVLDAKGDGVYHPITARPASRRERKLYSEEMAHHGHEETGSTED